MRPRAFLHRAFVGYVRVRLAARTWRSRNKIVANDRVEFEAFRVANTENERVFVIVAKTTFDLVANIVVS